MSSNSGPSWLSSWFPFNITIPNFQLPGIPLPSSIQGRFISFILKRTLGHLLKPGQLDVAQIDSQIGNGFVEIKDLELDCDAVNALLVDLPLRLEHGSLGKVTVRVPWPNPLTSAVGLCLSGIRLQLCLVAESKREPAQGVDLTQSAASVASSFIHEELSPKEEATLKQTFYEDLTVSTVLGQSNGPPGSLDPFYSEDDSPEREVEDGSTGISMFAYLIERLLSRFEFDADDIEVTVIHPHRSSLSLRLGGMHFRSTIHAEMTSDDPPKEATQSGAPSAVNRVITINDVEVFMRDLSSSSFTSPSPTSSTCSGSVTPTKPAADSDIDEETQIMMSQSIVGLPPRNDAPILLSHSVTSIASSLYESALTSAGEVGAGAQETISVSQGLTIEEPLGQKIFSITSDPLIVRLCTPVELVASHSEEPPKHEETRLEIRVGAAASALQARHLKGLMDMAMYLSDFYAQGTSVSSDSPRSSSGSFLDQLVFSLSFQSLVVVLFPPVGSETPNLTSGYLALDEGTLRQFYQRPQSPLYSMYSYFRIHIDSVAGLFSRNLPINTPGHVPSSSHSSGGLSLTVADFSVLFLKPKLDNRMLSFPVIITDPNLASNHHHSQSRPHDQWMLKHSSFHVFDWRTGSEHGYSLKPWRTRNPASHEKYDSHDVSARDSTTEAHKPASSLPKEPAISVKSQLEKNLDIQLTPLCFFLDLAMAGTLLHFFKVFDSAAPKVVSGAQSSVPPSPPATVLQSEAKKLHNRVLRDLNLSHDYDVNVNPAYNQPIIPTSTPSLKAQYTSTAPGLCFNVLFSFIRTQIRTPPPLDRSPRSGAIIIDIKSLKLSNSRTIPPQNTTRFQDRDQEPAGTEGHVDEIVGLTFDFLLLSYALCGETLARPMVAFERSHDDRANFEDISSNPRPALINQFPVPFLSVRSISRRSNPTCSTTAIVVNIPSINVKLTKLCFDGIQVWADDTSQLLERVSSGGVTHKTEGSKAPSMIGSRFFAQRLGSASTGDSIVDVTRNELVVQSLVQKVQIQVLFEEDQKDDCRWLDTRLLSLDTLIEVKPDGKDENVITVSVAEATANICSFSQGSIQTLLSTFDHGDLVDKPVIKVHLHSSTVPEATAKQSRINLALNQLLFDVSGNLEWIQDVQTFAKSPPEVFESVVPSEQTSITLKFVQSAVRISSPSTSDILVISIDDMNLATVLISESPEIKVEMATTIVSLLLTDSEDHGAPFEPERWSLQEARYWKMLGYALLAEICDLDLKFFRRTDGNGPDILHINELNLRLHLSADSASGIARFASSWKNILQSPPDMETVIPETNRSSGHVGSSTTGSYLLKSLDERAFRAVPQIGSTPDMINDDLPTNPDYLDESFGPAAGLRELQDDDLYDFDPDVDPSEDKQMPGSKDHPHSSFGGETIKMLVQSIDIIEHFYDTLPPHAEEEDIRSQEKKFSAKLRNFNLNVFLYEGYDWLRTRKAIEEESKAVRKRLAKIRQLLASGQNIDVQAEPTNALLFNSVYIGLDQDAEELESGDLIAAIDEELEDADNASQSPWQSLQANSANPHRNRTPHSLPKKLTRSRSPSIEFSLIGVQINVDHFDAHNAMDGRILVTIKDAEILDHIKTSTWRRFLTAARTDSKGNIRETDSNMARIELLNLRPYTNRPEVEARLKAKLLPLRLHVDQDALDFMKKFFSFSSPDSGPSSESPKDETYFQHVEIFPIDLKLDYKPRRVDYRALKEGKTMELMNFFHFDGAEMTLRHITLKGITGWARLGDTLNDLWTPDVKANQLVDVISGVSPIRSAVNVGSGIADLVLLPIAQYKKDGRVIRGLQKGTNAFIRSTAMEAIKLGARLATGTQVILEQAESVLGGQYHGSVTAEALQIPIMTTNDDFEHDIDSEGPISRYADQPSDIQEGVRSAYRSLSDNIKSAGQTILAVPMEVYERSSSDGPARAVVRAVPIAVLKPMIGATGAVRETLLGLRNTLDPGERQDDEAKYKHR